MAKARKTRQVKATTTNKKATQAKRKPLKNLDKNLANGKKKSQKPKVSRESSIDLGNSKLYQWSTSLLMHYLFSFVDIETASTAK